MTQQPGPEQMRKQYEAAEKRASSAMEELVGSHGFGEGLALFTSNAVALSRVATIGLDQVLRMTRIAGRSDVARLGRQLARTEDKLEQVLQVVEKLETELATSRQGGGELAAANGNGNGWPAQRRAGAPPASGTTSVSDEGDGGSR